VRSKIICAIVCGRTEDDAAKGSVEIYAQINKVLKVTENEEEIETLLQRKLDRITFAQVIISDEVFKLLEKYAETERPDKDHSCWICMHCKAIFDAISCKVSYLE
jgi:hypothetical protein